MKSYKDLKVWQKSIDLCEKIYITTEEFPQVEKYGITIQMRKCGVSIPSNIAEGYRRGTTKEYLHFLHISFGSGAELETQIYLAYRIKLINQVIYNELTEILDEIMKMLNNLIASLQNK